MAEGPQDIIVNVYSGMCADIRLMFEQERFPAFVVLTFAAIDSLSNACRLTTKASSPKRDFVDWTSRYFMLRGSKRPSPQELWSARCAIIHSYGVVNETHMKDSSHRVVTFVRSDQRDCIELTAVDQAMVVINLQSFFDAFNQAVHNSLERVMGDDEWRPIVEKRLEQFIQAVSIDPNSPVSRLLTDG